MNQQEFLSTANARELEMFGAMLVADAKKRKRRWKIIATLCVLALLIGTAWAWL